MATLVHDTPRNRRNLLVRWRFWFYGLLFLLVLVVLWWDRELRRAEFEAMRAPMAAPTAPKAASGR